MRSRAVPGNVTRSTCIWRDVSRRTLLPEVTKNQSLPAPTRSTHAEAVDSLLLLAKNQSEWMCGSSTSSATDESIDSASSQTESPSYVKTSLPGPSRPGDTTITAVNLVARVAATSLDDSGAQSRSTDLSSTCTSSSSDVVAASTTSSEPSQEIASSSTSSDYLRVHRRRRRRTHIQRRLIKGVVEPESGCWPSAPEGQAFLRSHRRMEKAQATCWSSQVRHRKFYQHIVFKGPTIESAQAPQSDCPHSSRSLV